MTLLTGTSDSLRYIEGFLDLIRILYVESCDPADMLMEERSRFYDVVYFTYLSVPHERLYSTLKENTLQED